MNPELIRIDVRIAWEFASCYGVNLAVSEAGLFFFFAGCEAVPLSKQWLRASFKTTAWCRFQNSGFIRAYLENPVRK
jgi:hypothetical protein